MSTIRHHTDWLSLVEVSGPFVSLPVLTRVFPQGLEPRDPTQAKVLRAAYEDWQDHPAAPGKQRAWVMHVLTSVLGYPENQIAEGQSLPAGLEGDMPEMGETLRPDFALVGPAGAATAGQPQLLIVTHPAEQSLDKPVAGRHWKATPATRMTELLHAANVPLGLVTNGEQWMLIYAPRGETTGYASWYGALWLDEPLTLRAFHSLLGVRRFFGVAADSTLLALLRDSASDQQEVTDQLGYQVREAVGVLVQSFDALDQEGHRACLSDIEPSTVYDAALTVMMRLVFLFSAEERGLLHLGKPLYDNNYAVSTLQEQLQEVADQYGEEVLERRYDAWARLVASFRAVHGGIQHQDMPMQAYGGSLFDPDRFPFLEGRATGSQWRSTAAEPLAVNNRVVLHLLNALQRLRTRTGGGVAETRRVSFRALGVEQIGHVYEGLLDHTAVRATEVVLGIRGTLKKEPEIALSKLEALLAQGEDKLLDHLKEETGRSLPALFRDLHEDCLLDEHKMLLACNHDEALVARLRPFAGLIREDSFERPWVVLSGRIYFTAGTTRRNTGTHYTPPSLTEPIVQHTLEPLIYVGPAEGLPREQWKLKSPKEILDLRVCDMAMGSGAFLVQACRYLGERLVEAWENAEKAHPGQVLTTPEGQFSDGSSRERLVPADAAERIAIARRAVADHCLFGVDINPMAVEMAKLSIWLITVDTNRPFTFLDHAFKCGDSLLGIVAAKELDWFYSDPHTGQKRLGEAAELLAELSLLRAKLEALPSDTPQDIENKAALLKNADSHASQLRILADVLSAARLTYSKPKSRAAFLDAAALTKIDVLEGEARRLLTNRVPLHWSLEFPEVIERGGFDAFVGNPPFVGGKKISGAMGADYRALLVESVANGVKGNADLSAYFFLRVGRLLRPKGMAGLLATNTIAQGDTREVGLDQLLTDGFTITRAVPSAPWPGVAALEVAHVWLHRGEWQGNCQLNDSVVPGITGLLSSAGRVTGNPFRLLANSDKSFIGSYVLSLGFVLMPDEAAALIAQNPPNAECLLPYLNGEDVNTRPDQSPTRWIINFRDWPLNRLGHGRWDAADEKSRKEWLRSGEVPSDYPGSVAMDYPDLLAIVEERVKPERVLLGQKADASAKGYARYWWRYGRMALGLYAAIAGTGRVLAVPVVTHHVSFAFEPSNIVFAHRLAVFPFSNNSMFAVLQSSIHESWARRYSSSLETRINYSPSDCFETFSFPNEAHELETIGDRYYGCRQSVMAAREEGLTKIYNRFHNPREDGADIIELRRLHIEIDRAVANSYGWEDLDLGHSFHETNQGIRFTISEAARSEVLDRLLALNHRRHDEEMAAAATDAIASPAKRGRKKKDVGNQAALDF
ncbi:Eco57I restriction-modification methylase domain-containing protein [Burkholderia sp. LMG 13014]|uniref:Eco57I restriction-modification methylase domain-containing protein n=1 Tax=Burkholderia sp. LMG 13014 TaxID=2709306 RepID=UPI001962CB9C|nr:DNA methyltransferase [Burkholderia sp. LMG 13014]